MADNKYENVYSGSIGTKVTEENGVTYIDGEPQVDFNGADLGLISRQTGISREDLQLERDALTRKIIDYGLVPLIEGAEQATRLIAQNRVPSELLQLMKTLADIGDNQFYTVLFRHYPRVQLLYSYLNDMTRQDEDRAAAEDGKNYVWDEYMKAFSNPYDPEKRQYQSAIGFLNTQQRLSEEINKHIRPDTPPAPVFPWELRLGASRFYVPPININVSQTFRAGSLTGGALRQQNSPKFNAGHSETIISMTLYFPNHESIWGLAEDVGADIAEGTNRSVFLNFDLERNEERIDRFLSSLRGLITQFKYAPFLPVKNQYLNSAYDITGVVMHSMTVSTLEGYPFCVAVNLNLLKFNHKAYLPMINDFHNAIHWGKYRQYMGRAAQRMARGVSQGFLVEKRKGHAGYTDDATRRAIASGKIDPNTLSQEITVELEDPDPDIRFNTQKEWDDGKNFHLYYPLRTPLQVLGPDIADFRQPGEDDVEGQRGKNTWEAFLGHLGIDKDTDPDSIYDLGDFDTANTNSRTLRKKEYDNARLMLQEWLKEFGRTVDQMNGSLLQEWKAERRKQYGRRDLSPEAEEVIDKLSVGLWFDFILNNYTSSPYFQAYLKDAQFHEGNLLIHEWEVPMGKLEINWDNVKVDGVSVTLANNIARMQLQMQQEPVHQHIGGKDAQIDVSLTVFGEDDIVRLRRVFEHINGLARLEHAHGVLGFLGIKNVLTALCGIKHVLPLNFEVDTIPGYPRVYNVRMSFTDFDVFQQSREQLNNEQQKELIDAFGKRNPFLRVKQLWGSFNAYPDFPLDVKDNSGKIIGHLDPDYYFKAFQTIDDSIVRGVFRGENTNYNPADIAQAQPYLREDLARQARHTGTYDGIRPPTEAESASGVTASGIDYSEVKNTEDLTAKDYAHRVEYFMGPLSEESDRNQFVEINRDGISLGYADLGGGKTYELENITVEDDVPSRTLITPNMPGAETVPFAKYGAEYFDGTASPDKQLHMMMVDAQYRDISGRMLRAYPTYMLWLIDEGGNFAGVKLFDNFYGLQSVIDFSLVQSEDILGDTLILRVSNLYSKLTSKFKEQLSDADRDDPNSGSPEEQALALLVDLPRDRQRNLNSGLIDTYEVEIESIRLRPGVRIHLRMGYSANPNSLPTVFNGTITQVEAGDIVTITAQSDAIELSPVLNTTNKKGHSGSVNEGFFGALWLSEPRDLMVRLLSMGSSTFKEAFSHAFKGMIFSENRFGIRHFGQILYEPMSRDEEVKAKKRRDIIKQGVDNFTGNLGTDKEAADTAGEVAGAGAQFVGLGGDDIFFSDSSSPLWRSPAIELMHSMFANFMARRDYEIFKRNIYPGNGLGIAQYLGGDIIDGGLSMATTAQARQQQQLQSAMSGSQVDEVIRAGQDDNARADLNNSAPGQDVEDGSIGNTSPLNIIAGATLTNPIATFNVVAGIVTSRSNHPFLRMMGINNADDDLQGYDEISFRAQTYMKSVWDMFQLCAALLPNYIVAVRPFEDRSTVFYGKPHWLYTSGVVPVTTGIPKGGGPSPEEIDEEIAQLQREASLIANPLTDAESEAKFYENLKKVSPYNTTGSTAAGTAVTAEQMAQYRTLRLDRGGKTIIPARSGSITQEMHLPTSSNLETDVAQHLQIAELAPHHKHPYFMDRSSTGHHGKGTNEGGVGGVHGNTDYSPTGAVKIGDSALWPGVTGFMGHLDPLEEQWYMNMYWPNGVRQQDLKGARILVFNSNNGKACVCTPGDKGPSKSTGHVAGLSPDVFHYLEATQGQDGFFFGVLNDDARLGPVVSNAGSQISAETEKGEELSTSADRAERRAVEARDEVAKWYDPDKAGDASIYEYEHGFNDLDVPVYIDPDSGVYQDEDVARNTGYHARLLYDIEFNEREREKAAEAEEGEATKTPFAGTINGAGRTLSEAESIWDQFRKHFESYDDVQGHDDEEGYETIVSGGDTDTEQYKNDVAEFMRWMWQDAYNRAWLVIVTARHMDDTQLFSSDLGGFDTGELFDLNPFDDGDEWNFSTAAKAWHEWLKAKYVEDKPTGGGTGSVEEATLAWMEDHDEEGAEASALLGRAVEKLDEAWDQTVGKLITAVNAGLSGLVNLYRMSMMQLGNGLDMAGAMQQQANLLNKVFNDSIYYAAGDEGSILRLVDNPFTREYGEPVVEIREPFQRMHYMNSFQHIIHNGIIENTDGVATVVTASSDGKYPVTVHFDKGSPPERQQEISVETGLFWDNAKGSGVLGILHPLFHPIETMRGVAKAATGSSDELLSKRVGLYHLKESLKDIYGGEIVCLGNPDIRPHDLVYIADVYERIYGMFEVEQVIHHFTPDQGFITTVTPNAIVTINDPARWSMISWIWSWWAVKNMRDDVRQMLDVQADVARAAAHTEINPYDLASSLETQFRGHLQYTQGGTALIKDIASSASMGLVSQKGAAKTRTGGFGDVLGATVPVQALTGAGGALAGGALTVATGGAALPLVLGGAAAGVAIGDLATDAWNWIRDNVLDQHGCYIQYLNKNGKAMDGGLSYAQGVSVGRHHSVSLLPGILGIRVNNIVDGHKRITTNDLLAALGWKEIEINNLVREVSWWNALTNVQILETAGRSPDEISFQIPLVEIGNVTDVIDGDTFILSNGKHIRLAGIDTSELEVYDNRETEEDEAMGNVHSERAILARQFLTEKIKNKTVAVRYNRNKLRDEASGGTRWLGVVFHNVPEGTPDEERGKALRALAQKWPLIEWDSYMDDSRPYTINWEMAMSGLASIYMTELRFNNPDEGAAGYKDESHMVGGPDA